jgi:NADPH-dependent glutamate synthase beta subunit-like oxidoreductase
MELGPPDQSGRRRPVPKPGSEFHIETDLVIMAIGAGANPLDPDTDEDGLLDGQEISAASNPASADSDEDLVSDLTDNCRATFNPDQADNDRDGVGDLCDISIVFLPAILK